jgi:hypothetical protein
LVEVFSWGKNFHFLFHGTKIRQMGLIYCTRMKSVFCFVGFVFFFN